MVSGLSVKVTLCLELAELGAENTALPLLPGCCSQVDLLAAPPTGVAASWAAGVPIANAGDEPENESRALLRWRTFAPSTSSSERTEAASVDMSRRDLRCDLLRWRVAHALLGSAASAASFVEHWPIVTAPAAMTVR